MNKIYILIICIATFSACTDKQAEANKIAEEKRTKEIQDSLLALGDMVKDSINKGIEKYDIESGKVDYISDFGAGGKSTKLVVFDRFGARQVRSTPFVKILDRDGFSYSINPADDLGTKLYTENGDAFNPDLIDFKGLNMVIKKRYHYKELKKDKVLGRDCQVVQVENGEMNIAAKYWLYKFIPLKIEVKIMGSISTFTAIKFEENIPIDVHTFDLPKKLRMIKVKNRK